MRRPYRPQSYWSAAVATPLRALRPSLAYAPHTPDEEGCPLLSGDELSRYQFLAASLNYFSLDRLDFMYAVKEMMKKLSKPNDDDWQKLKRVARYLITAPRLVMQYPWQSLTDTFKMYTDADHAGCLRTRKPTSEGVVVWGPAPLKACSRTQTLIALSSGQSELAIVTKAAAEAMGIQAVLADFGVPFKIEIHSDATAAIGICKRQGLGRVRDLATADLWIQLKVSSRELKLFKLPGKDNPCDLMTKQPTAPEASRFMSMLGIRRLDGRPALAPSSRPSKLEFKSDWTIGPRRQFLVLRSVPAWRPGPRDADRFPHLA